MEIKVGIIGSRRRNSIDDLKCLINFITPYMEECDEKGHKITFVSGGCPKGGDRFAEMLAKQWDIPIIIHYPDKSKLPDIPTRKDFRKINFARNILIAEDSDMLIAIVAYDRTGGTEHTIKKFKQIHPRGEIYTL